MKWPRRTGWLFWPALLLVFLGVQAWKDRSLIEGRPPPLGTRALDGAEFAWQHVEGRPAVLYFWATWCPICRATRGSVEALAADYPVISVALQSGSEHVLRDYVRSEGFSLPVYPDPEGTIAARFGLQGVPAIFVVDAGGTIRYAVTGFTSELGLRIRLWLAALPLTTGPNAHHR